MNAVDWVLIGLMLLSGALGFWRGVVKEFFALLAWVLGFVVCSRYAFEWSRELPLPAWAQGMREAVAWVLIFLLVMLVMALIGSVLKRLLSLAGLGLADRLLGVVFGVARASIMWMAMAVVVGLTPLRDSDAWVNSHVAQSVHQLLVYLKPVLPAPLERLVT
jgi:membrane protein required for colicin V production